MAQYQVTVNQMDGFTARTIAMFAINDEGDAEFNVPPDPVTIALIRGALDALEGKAKGVKMRSIGTVRPETKADRAAKDSGNGG